MLIRVTVYTKEPQHLNNIEDDLKSHRFAQNTTFGRSRAPNGYFTVEGDFVLYVKSLQDLTDLHTIKQRHNCEIVIEIS